MRVTKLQGRNINNPAELNTFSASVLQLTAKNLKKTFVVCLATCWKLISIILFWFFGIGSLCAQHPGFEINYPGPHAESARAMTTTNDGGYVMTGYQGINIGVSNIALRKVNSDGEEQWVQYLGNGGTNIGHSIAENAWGKLVVAGQTSESTPSPSHREAYLAELDENGILIWERTFHHAAGNGFINAVKPTSDMGYVVAGGQVNLIGESTNTDVFIAKTSAVGDTIWTFKWGTTNLDLINDIFIQQDGSILCAGVTYSEQVFQDMLLLKLSEDGELIWLHAYDIEGFDVARSIGMDNENNIILGGHSDYVNGEDYDLPDICVVKVDSTGNLIWYKKYGGDKDDGVNDVVIDDANNIYAIGISASYKPPGSPSGYSGYLTKLNPEGDSLWTRVFYENSTNFHNIQHAPNGGFMICGGTNARMYLVRTDEWGCVEEGCELNTAVLEYEDKNKIQITAWPNPTRGLFQLSSSVSLSEDHHLVMFDLNGRIIQNWKNPIRHTKSKEFDISSYSNGVYILKLIMDSGESEGEVFRLLKN